MPKRRGLIVGGTSGIGLAVAKMLAGEGDDVTISGRRRAGGEIPSVILDLEDEEGLVHALTRYSSGGLDYLIYAAAEFAPPRNIVDHTNDEARHVYTVNVFGLLASLRALYPSLQRSKGRVVVINSIAGRAYSQSAGVLYTSSKYALSGLVRQLSSDFARDGVLINALFLGPVDAGMTKQNLSPAEVAALEARIPLKRLAKVEDIFPAINFLLDPANEYVTGAGIDINGGAFVTG